MSLIHLFSSTGNRLANSIPQSNSTLLQYLPPKFSNSFYLSPVSEIDIVDEISILGENKATRPFSIPIKILKLLKVLI